MSLPDGWGRPDDVAAWRERRAADEAFLAAAIVNAATEHGLHALAFAEALDVPDFAPDVRLDSDAYLCGASRTWGAP